VFFDTLTEFFQNILLLFSNFEAKCGQNGSKYRKNRQTKGRDLVWFGKKKENQPNYQ
jgi:hypothetical protein